MLQRLREKSRRTLASLEQKLLQTPKVHLVLRGNQTDHFSFVESPSSSPTSVDEFVHVARKLEINDCFESLDIQSSPCQVSAQHDLSFLSEFVQTFLPRLLNQLSVVNDQFFVVQMLLQLLNHEHRVGEDQYLAVCLLNQSLQLLQLIFKHVLNPQIDELIFYIALELSIDSYSDGVFKIAVGHLGKIIRHRRRVHLGNSSQSLSPLHLSFSLSALLYLLWLISPSGDAPQNIVQFGNHFLLDHYVCLVDQDIKTLFQRNLILSEQIMALTHSGNNHLRSLEKLVV